MPQRACQTARTHLRYDHEMFFEYLFEGLVNSVLALDFNVPKYYLLGWVSFSIYLYILLNLVPKKCDNDYQKEFYGHFSIAPKDNSGYSVDWWWQYKLLRKDLSFCK